MNPFEVIARRRLLPAVASLETPEQAVALARAYLEAGLDVMEVTLRHPAALDCIRAITSEVPDMTCGAGTIIKEDQISAARKAGATFGVSPGFNPKIVHDAGKRDFPFAPGVATPGEIEQALALGCRHMKVFPVEPLGGLAYIKAIAAPYAHTGVQFIPMGGINADNFERYLEVPVVAAVGLSALSPAELVRDGKWGQLTERTKELVERASEE